MSEQDDGKDVIIEHIADVLRAPEPTATDFTARLMAVAKAMPPATADTRSKVGTWWTRRRTVQFSITPVGALTIAAGIALFAAFAGTSMRQRNVPAASSALASTATVPPRSASVHTDTVRLVRFVFMSPGARSVTMVGDFNNWDRTATPLRRMGSSGTWGVTVPLLPGPHQYAFVVDGTVWTPDPASTTTVSDDFGTLTSLIAVGGAS